MAGREARGPESGELSVQVTAYPIVAGKPGTVTLVIRNPFTKEIVIDSIEAPSSGPSLPRIEPKKPASQEKGDFFERFFSNFSIGFLGTAISTGPLVADFGKQAGRKFTFDLQPHSKLTIKRGFQPRDAIMVSAAEGAEVFLDPADASDAPDEAKSIFAHQTDVATFDLRTAHWLFVTPKVFDLQAVIRYRIGTIKRVQVVPLSITVRPPLLSIMLGTVSGSLFGYAARVFTTAELAAIGLVPSLISVLGVIVMAIILAIVLSRQDGSKGFVTLEDFYGAFIVGVILGYTGTSYFEGVIGPLGDAPAHSVPTKVSYAA